MLKASWSKSYPVTPRDYFISHIRLKDKVTFKPSYENERFRAPIGSLLSWEYAHRWVQDRDKFAKENLVKTKIFKNDYKLWLEKRKPRVNRNCKAQGTKKLLKETKKPEKK